MNKRIFYLPALFFALALAVTGCGSKKFTLLQTEHQELQTKYKDLDLKYLNSQHELTNAQSRVQNLEEQIASYRSNVASLQSALDKCLSNSGQGNANISKLVDEINASNRYIQHLVNTKNKSDSLNMVLTNNLTRSLSQGEMKDVDVQVLKGVVYISLSDNMLYKSGSYEISAQANETLGKIAKIIMDYKDYEVLIEGNTDSQPIKKSNIRNNWDLSALRASSVVQALQDDYGVSPKRLTAGGRGEYNPVADNSSAEGRAKNRRTQIIITPKLDQFMELIDQAPESGPSDGMEPTGGDSSAMPSY